MCSLMKPPMYFLMNSILIFCGLIFIVGCNDDPCDQFCQDSCHKAYTCSSISEVGLQTNRVANSFRSSCISSCKNAVKNLRVRDQFCEDAPSIKQMSCAEFNNAVSLGMEYFFGQNRSSNSDDTKQILAPFPDITSIDKDDIYIGECEKDVHCDGNKVCSDNKCVECTNDYHCPNGVCDEYKGCVQCINDDDCPSAKETCYLDNKCYVRCESKDECEPNSFCDGTQCTAPIGQPCSREETFACGAGNCINVDANNLTVPGYCSSFCYQRLDESDPCPGGFVCKRSECRQL